MCCYIATENYKNDSARKKALQNYIAMYRTYTNDTYITPALSADSRMPQLRNSAENFFALLLGHLFLGNTRFQIIQQ